MSRSPEQLSMPDSNSNQRLVCEGEWSEGVAWQFFIDKQLPKPELCTSVFSVVIVDNQLVICRHPKRGWELPGGHIENEDIAVALNREVAEEVGVKVEQVVYFGYKRISSDSPLPRRDGGFYPFPYSYLPYFMVAGQQLNDFKLAEDIAEARLVSLDTAQQLLNPTQAHFKIVLAGLAATGWEVQS